MKTLFTFLFFPFFVFCQTVAERQKIANSYNQEEIDNLMKSYEAFSIVQKKRIDEYKKQHPFIESEKMSLQRIEDDGTPIFYTTFNAGSSRTIGTNKMYPGGSLGLNITGEGMIAGVWDGGRVRETHQEFNGGKVTLNDDAATISNHATHVAGTVMATGFSPLRRGIAYGAEAYAYDWGSDYTEMLAFGSVGYLVSNHSYGYIASSLAEARFGQYDASSIEIDNASNANPYYQICIAAGNDRDNFNLTQVGNKAGYDLLSGFGTSKNGITVAAIEEVSNYLNENSVTMSTFSNFGPTDDGRIKPDISAKGIDVSSCIGNGNASYASYQGTSMAAPAISGMVLMLQKHYNNLSTSNYMRASTVRGLICHSAKEAGLNPGPDYEFGWGLANAELAANIITNRNNTTILEENTIVNGQTFTKQISIAANQKLSATICWTDPTGSANVSSSIDNRISRLRNNLDLKIIKDGIIFYPWKLNPDDPASAATNVEENDVDNVEKVEIDNAQPGVYIIQVTHKASLSGGSQVFSLIANATNGLNLNTSNYEFDNSIFIYPNPATTILNFQVNNDITIDTVSVTDISGKQIFKASNKIDNAIDISNLSSGVYFVTFTSESNSITKKFIKD